MTVVYLDVLFLLNFVVDYLLLLAAARITGEVFSRLRLVLGALLGGVYAAVIFLPGCVWLSNPACKISAGIGMVLISYGASRRLLRLTLVFFAGSAALGGVILGLQLLGTGGLTLENGVLYTGFDLRLLLVTVILSYVALSTVFRNAARHGGQRQDLCAAKVTLCGQTAQITVLLDTGNTLTDPVRNQPVLVVEGRALREILPVQIDPRDPVGSLEWGTEEGWNGRFGLLPYRAVGVACGLLLTVRSDCAVISGREWKGLTVALSPTPVSDGGGYQGLFGVQGQENGRKKHEMESTPDCGCT